MDYLGGKKPRGPACHIKTKRDGKVQKKVWLVIVLTHARTAGCPLLARDYAVSTRDTIARIEVVIQFNLLCLRIHHSRETFKASACV